MPIQIGIDNAIKGGTGTGTGGGGTPPVFEGLLDTYPGAAAGYSVRRLSSSATNLMRIREDAGDTETDIGYDSNNELDTAAIAAHCGSADGFVVTWTDQSSNANDAEQAAVVNQPQIYDGATAAVILENGKPAVETTGAHLQLATALTSVSDIFWVAKANSTNFSYLVKSSGDLAVRSLSLAYRLVTTSAGDWTNTSSYVYFNGVAQTSDPSSASQGLGYIGGGSRDFLQISTDFGGGGPVRDWEGNIQEILLWPSSQTTPTDNRTGIETNINTEFSVYPTSG